MPTPARDSGYERRRRGDVFGDAESTPPRKVIRSDRVHYQGLEDVLADGRWAAEEGRSHPLRPARDAGISIERRVSRERRRAAKRRRSGALAIALACIAVLGLALVWRWSSDRSAAARPLTERSQSRVPAVTAAAAEPQPTPLFASYSALKIRLPVSAADVTEVGFHQASYSYALPLKTPMPDAKIESAKEKRGTHRDVSKQPKGENAVLVGSVLRMWRDRPGKPDTAVDVGALAGSPIVAPLSGTVVLVKSYKLYSRFPDYQVHIQPDGAPNVDCVLIHVDSPKVKAGDRVMAGTSPIGVVRKFSGKINLQLAHYTPTPGDHVHIQLNNAKDPSYEGLKGAIAVETP